MPLFGEDIGSLWPTTVLARLQSLTIKQIFYHCALPLSNLSVNLLLRALVAIWKVTAPVKLPHLHC